jgi:FMN phosphatase YigB (HAD superfamily)
MPGLPPASDDGLPHLRRRANVVLEPSFLNGQVRLVGGVVEVVTMSEVLLLDAMGVLYEAGDDVGQLLIPFVRKFGSSHLSAEAIDRAYTDASLGKLDASAFWRLVEVEPALEDQYLSEHRLIEGTLEALARLKGRYKRISCLSNDVSGWSAKLRRRFGLKDWIDTWLTSGDLGMRKPSLEIYRCAVDRLNAEPEEIIFVDDRLRNLDAAKLLGIQTVHLSVENDALTSPDHRRIRQLCELI